MSSRTRTSIKRRTTAPPGVPGRRERSHAARDLTQLGAMGKAFSILKVITAGRQPLSMAEIVRTSGLTKPIAHRITTVLAEMGFNVGLARGIAISATGLWRGHRFPCARSSTRRGAASGSPQPMAWRPELKE